ncbi:MAG: nucleotidyltransferase family protein, partial [Bacteroidales bacterium]|nr:nucleotidyltransferase family protein [Bacteroidales bacterium]
METLEKKHQLRNLNYILALTRYFFKTDKKPIFLKSILKDMTFLSLVKNINMAGITYLSLSEFDEFKDTWLERELKNYYNYGVNQDLANKKVFDELYKFCSTNKEQVVYIRDSAFKNEDFYVTGSRFSTDIDILINKPDIFKFHNYLKDNNYLLQGVDFQLIYKPHLYKSGFYEIIPKNDLPYHKNFIIDGLNNNYRTFNYYKDAFLEIHIPVSTNSEIPKSEYWKYAKNNVLTPEFDLITQANHFFLHLKYNDTQPNRLKTFLAFLERVVDILYLFKKEINFDKIVELSIHYNVQHQVYYYLYLAKRYLNLNITKGNLQKLRKASLFSDILAIKFLLPDKKILRDKHTKSIKFYCDNFLEIKETQKSPKPKIKHKSKEANLILEILSDSEIYNPYNKNFPKYNSKRFIKIIKETSLDGLFYHKLKDNNSVKTKDLEHLKQGYKIILEHDELLLKNIQKIQDIPISKTFLKDSTSRINNKYINGTRYSCDIDLLRDSNHAIEFDSKMQELNYFSDGIEIKMPAEDIALSFHINKDISKYQDFAKAQDFTINKYLFERENLSLETINNLKNNIEKNKLLFHYCYIAKTDSINQINRIKKIELKEDKSINYHGIDRGYIDVHYKLFNNNPSIKSELFNIEAVQISEYNHILQPEDKIILDACHFFLNMSKFRKEY